MDCVGLKRRQLTSMAIWWTKSSASPPGRGGDCADISGYLKLSRRVSGCEVAIRSSCDGRLATLGHVLLAVGGVAGTRNSRVEARSRMQSRDQSVQSEFAFRWKRIATEPPSSSRNFRRPSHPRPRRPAHQPRQLLFHSDSDSRQAQASMYALAEARKLILKLKPHELPARYSLQPSQR